MSTSRGMKVAVLVYSLILLGLALFLWPQPLAASPSAVIQSHSMWISSIGTLHIFGEVRNTGDTWIQSVKITATLTDTPTIEVSPSKVRHTESITITGYRFTGNGQVEIYIDGKLMIIQAANQQGTFQIFLYTTPYGIGEHSVYAVDLTTSRQSNTVEFIVTPEWLPQTTTRAESPSTETSVASAITGIPFGTLGSVGLVAAVVLASLVLVLVRRRQAVPQLAVSKQEIQAEPVEESTLPEQVFISYSSEDMEPAMQICKLLEERGIACWITPRDVMPGRSYGEEIINAIESTSATVLVLSEHANLSVHVKNEIERAVSKGKTIIPIRIREVQPSKALELFISSAQWIDAFRPPLEAQIDALAGAIKLLKAGRK